MVFCGECGSPVASASAPGDRSARLPPGGNDMRRARTLVGALPGVPVSPQNAPPVPTSERGDTRRTVVGMPGAATAAAETRTPAVTMVSPIAEAKPAKGGSKRRRTGSFTTEAMPPSEAKPEAPRAPSEPPPRPAPGKAAGDATKAPVEAPKAASTAAKAAAAETAKAKVDDAPQIEVHADSAPATPLSPITVEAGKPPPAEKARASTPPADLDETQRLLEDLDAGFESIVRPSAPVVWIGSPGDAQPPVAGAAPEDASQPTPSTQARVARHEADMAEVRSLFAGIAVAYARPLRDFMIEVAWGEPTKEWLDVALPATQALRRAAAAVELPEVDTALEGYQTALELGMGEGSIHREVREMLAGAYARLIDAMPTVFSLEGELGRREPIIVRSLLLQVPGVRHVAIEKLYRAGINALDVFYAARPRELAEATGLDEAIAAAICERFQRYKREVAELSPGKEREKERAELEALTDELAREHEAHEKASSSWAAGAAAERSRARQARADAVLRVDVLLAHLGEVDLQRTISKVPFQQKIKELRRYLEDARQRAAR